MPDVLQNNWGLKAVLLIFNVFGIMAGFSQSTENISPGLKSLGLENIRTINYEGTTFVSIENNIYRWDPMAVAEALNMISKNITDSSEINLILIKKGIPQFLISVNSNAWNDLINGIIDCNQVSDKLQITWEIDKAWKVLKNEIPINPNSGKTDIVVYPQFAFENTRLAKNYETRINIAPAIEFSGWKGNKFTGQVIFPVHNELGYEGNFIRPGFVTISQNFRLPKQWFSRFTAGNFSQNRYGFEMYFQHPFKNKNWNLELQTGLTGYSHFLNNQWKHGKLNTITWSSSLSWYFSRFNMVLRGGAEQYIYNDVGLFASCTRYFGETLVGFYAMAGESNLNGGFTVTIPLPFKKRAQRKLVRLTIPTQYSMIYNAGTELYYGQTFYSNSDGNQIKSYIFIQLFKNEILNLKK